MGGGGLFNIIWNFTIIFQTLLFTPIPKTEQEIGLYHHFDNSILILISRGWGGGLIERGAY